MLADRGEVVTFLVGLMVIVTSVVGGVWALGNRSGGSGGRATPSKPAALLHARAAPPAHRPARAHRHVTPLVPPVVQQPSPRKPAPAPAPKLVLTAAHGDSWLEIRSGSATGGVVYLGVLTRGRSLTFPANRLWIRMGAPENVVATLRGRSITLPSSTGNLVVTRSGAVRPG